MVGAIQSGSSLTMDMMAQMRESMFARLDGDGQISAEEIAAMSAASGQTEMPPDVAEHLQEADTGGTVFGAVPTFLYQSIYH